MTSKASGRRLKLAHNNLGEKWTVLELAAVEERRPRREEPGKEKLLLSCHQNLAHLPWEPYPILASYTQEKSNEKPHEHAEGLGRTF